MRRCFWGVGARAKRGSVVFGIFGLRAGECREFSFGFMGVRGGFRDSWVSGSWRAQESHYTHNAKEPQHCALQARSPTPYLSKFSFGSLKRRTYDGDSR